MSGRPGSASARVIRALPRAGTNISLRRDTVYLQRACRGCSQEIVPPSWRWSRSQRHHEITGSYRG
jgi:hypothetical protein